MYVFLLLCLFVSIVSATSEVATFGAWVAVDGFCLALGWLGVLFYNDAGNLYHNCQSLFLDLLNMP